MENKKYSQLLFGVLGIISIALLTILDQWTKHLAVLHLAGQNNIILIPGVFELEYLENRGAAFGIMQNQQWIFILLTVVYLIAAIYIYMKIPKTKHYWPFYIVLILVTAGALGNFIDRIRLNYVVDFFYFSLINFPIFNVADIYVTVSMALLILFSFTVYKDEDFSFLSLKKQEK